MSTPSPSTTSSFATSIPSSPSPSGPRYHPNFTESSGVNVDVMLVARGGMHFRINATALRLASGYFAKTLSLPQSVEMETITEWKEPAIDPLDEDSEVLEDLLRIVSGKEILPDRLASLDALQSRLLAAKKWDMRAALSIMCVLLRTNPDVSSDPMRVYWLGCHFGWKDVTSAASKYSCSDDLSRADKQSPLGQVDATDLLRLVKFHQAHKDQMQKHLTGSTFTSHTHNSNCFGLGISAEYQNFAWKVLQEMDHTSPARKISDEKLLSMGAEAQLGAYPCRSCTTPARHSLGIFMQIHRFWDTLQQTITV